MPLSNHKHRANAYLSESYLLGSTVCVCVHAFHSDGNGVVEFGDDLLHVCHSPGILESLGLQGHGWMVGCLSFVNILHVFSGVISWQLLLFKGL